MAGTLAPAALSSVAEGPGQLARSDLVGARLAVAVELRADARLAVDRARLGIGLDDLAVRQGDGRLDGHDDLAQPRELLAVDGGDVVVEAHGRHRDHVRGDLA